MRPDRIHISFSMPNAGVENRSWSPIVDAGLLGELSRTVRADFKCQQCQHCNDITVGTYDPSAQAATVPTYNR